MTILARLLVRTFFRSIEVERADRLSPDLPTVLVANHQNGLVDALLLMAALPRYPRFLGKSTLFHILPLWPFLKLAGVVPVYRAKDGGSTERNHAAFATCRSLLGRRGMVALFPEGISHDQPMLQPLRTGAARIALGATVEDGVADTCTVAVGLVYDAKATFRSRALVRVGVPASVAPRASDYRVDDHQAVRSLTDELATRLRLSVPDYASWAQAEAVQRIADVVGRTPATALPVDTRLIQRQRVADALAAAEAAEWADANEIDGATGTHGATGTGAGAVRPVAQMHAAFAAYQRDLEMVGLTDAQVAAHYDSGGLRWMLLWEVVKLVVAAPLAALGVVIHVIPYEIIKRLARLPVNDGIRSTVKLLGSFASYAIVYAVIGVVVGTWLGPLAGAAAAVAAPACGYVTVRMSERLKRVGGVARGARAARSGGRILQSVLSDREAVVDAAQRVLAGPG
jgi:glycerol-3-phosphate O-acyltransferase/dihydroxyacetone phosphate acyltransferase